LQNANRHNTYSNLSALTYHYSGPPKDQRVTRDTQLYLPASLSDPVPATYVST